MEGVLKGVPIFSRDFSKGQGLCFGIIQTDAPYGGGILTTYSSGSQQNFYCTIVCEMVIKIYERVTLFCFK